MWFITAVIFSVLSILATYKITDLQEVLQGCHPGDIAENEYNKCICTPSYIFECFEKPYNHTISNTNEKPTCYPDMIYSLGSMTCICDNDGFWPHDKCETILRSFPNKATEKRCEPDSYVVTGCNVCKCAPNGFIDRSHCTKNKCNSTVRRFMTDNHVYGSCKGKNWYSLAPCQFCYCISDNKLVCNTGSNNKKTLQLGSYNLSVCGEELITDAMSLVPDIQKQSILREGIKDARSKAPIPTTDNIIKDETRDVAAEVNPNESYEETVLEGSDYYTDSDSKNQEIEIHTNDEIKRSTKFTYQKRDEISKTKSVTFRNPSEETVEVQTTRKPVDFFNPGYSKKSANMSEPVKSKILRENDQKYNIRDLLHPYVPLVLNKVFKMALRNSYHITVYNETCVPETLSYKDCNQCFCFKKSTLVCTNILCD